MYPDDTDESVPSGYVLPVEESNSTSVDSNTSTHIRPDRSATGFIQYQTEHSSELLLTEEGRKLTEVDSILDINKCSPVTRAQPYLLGELLDDSIDLSGDSEGSFNIYCAANLKDIKLVHLQQEHKESFNEYSFNDASLIRDEPPRFAALKTMRERRAKAEPYFRYKDTPSLVLLIVRKDAPNVLEHAVRRIIHLRDKLGVNVLVEPSVRQKVEQLMKSAAALDTLPYDVPSASALEYLLKGIDRPNLTMNGIVTWKNDHCISKLGLCVDFGVVLGGDGTVLWTSLLFPKLIPPLLCVAMGSLGYLTAIRPENCEQRIENLVVGGSFKAELRCRLEAYLTDRNDEPVLSKEFTSQTGSLLHESKGITKSSDDVLTMTVLNDLVISKECFGQLCTLDCYLNGEFFTTCTADGLIIATPTGSTAYNMSAGGSIVHPDVPAMLFTPICAHSLSVRPLVLPDSAVLSIKNPHDNRNPNPMIMCRDGFGSNELKLPPGYTVHVRVSKYPVPLIIRRGEEDVYYSPKKSNSWINSLTERLKWNYRRRQNGNVI